MRKTGFVLFIFLFTLTVSAQVTNVSAQKKLSPALQKLINLKYHFSEKIFWVVATDADSLQSYILQKKLPASILRKENTIGLLVIETSWGTIEFLLKSVSGIKFIDVPRKPVEELAVASYDLSVNAINLSHKSFPLINGSNMVVSVKENRFDTLDIDFKGRYVSVAGYSPTLSTHASIMATLIAGGGNSFISGKGAAWSAGISSANFASLLPESDTYYQQFKLSVQNHSYGTGIENYYGIDAAAYDATVISNPSLLHVFSAGNSGDQTSDSGVYTGISNFATLTGSFKMSKNSIVVAAVDSFASPAFLSSKGPAHDGRIKPELCAFGEDGSSGAAALVSGIALLIQQAYKQINNELPTAALTKAVLINSADDIGIAGPDFGSGFGNVNAFKAIKTIVNQHYYNGSVSNNIAQSFSLEIPANIRSIKITLCWNDPPAPVNAAKSLINDIDLELTDNSNNWKPWVPNSKPNRDSLLLPATRNRDSLNNVEQITIQNPIPGAYSIRVYGFSIPDGSQPFSIAYEMDTADLFDWYYPTATDKLPALQKNILRWKTSFNINSGKLESSFNNGATWQLISEAIDLSKGYYNWNAPDIASPVIFRMTINGNTFYSDTSSISTNPVLSVGFNCSDSLLLYWSKVPTVSRYRIYYLGEKYLQPFTDVSDSLLVIPKSTSPSLYYSVAPVISNMVGLRSYTINYATQGVGCYIRNFLPELENEKQVRINIELGTVYLLSNIEVEKLSAGNFISIQSISLAGNTQFTAIDSKLHRGGNTYRLKLNLTNGKVIYSNPETVLYFADAEYLIFPNPVSVSSPRIHVLSKDLIKGELRMFSSTGQLVKVQRLSSPNETVSTENLQKGVYILHIQQEGKKEFTSKIIIQ